MNSRCGDIIIVCRLLFLKFFLLLSLFVVSPFNTTYGQSHNNNSHIPLESWMNSWMSEFEISGGVLHLTRFKDPVYILTRPITWDPDTQNSQYESITVPKGFVTDLASIPKSFFQYLDQMGNTLTLLLFMIIFIGLKQ